MHGDDDYLATLKRPPADKCCSRCRATLPLDMFDMTSAHGRPYRRAWCKLCLKRYYHDHNRTKRQAAEDATS